MTPGPRSSPVAMAWAVAALMTASGAAASPAPAHPKPMRIMSINLCTDMLLVQLVPKSRIASVTYLAHEGLKAIGQDLDVGLAINHGAAEEIVAQKPDLILAGSFSAAMTKALARRVGANVVEVKGARNFEDIRQIVRQVGDAVGEPGRARLLVARMDRRLADLAATAPPRRYSVAAWSGDAVPGRGTLSNAIIEAAGAINVAAMHDDDRYSTFGIEELLEARPDVLMYGMNGAEKPSLTAGATRHRAIRRLYAGRQITYPETLYSCGAPQSADAAFDLRQALKAIPPRSGR